MTSTAMTSVRVGKLPHGHIDVWRSVCDMGVPVTIEEIRQDQRAVDAAVETQWTLQRIVSSLVNQGYLTCRTGRFERLNTYWFAPSCNVPRDEEMPQAFEDRVGAVATSRSLPIDWTPPKPSLESLAIERQMAHDRRYRRSRIGDWLHYPDGRRVHINEPDADHVAS